jgi:hypothetical protein
VGIKIIFMVNWDRAAMYFTYVAVGIMIIIMLLGLSGVFEAKMPGAGKKCNLPDLVCGIGTAIGFPEEWLNTKTFLWYSIIPILGIWLIIYGFLDRIRIFRSAISGVLAFLIAFSTVPLGIFVIIVATMFSIMGVYSVILFFGLFIIGTIMFSIGRYRGWKGIFLKSYDKAIDSQNRLLNQVEKDILNIQRKMERIQRNKRMGSREKANLIATIQQQAQTLYKKRERIIQEIKYLRSLKKQQRKMIGLEEKT